VPIDLHQLRTLVAAAEQGSLRRGAAVLGRRQSTVTAAIQSLERELRTPLFERAGRTKRPTASGSQLVDRVKAILQQIDDLPRIAAELEGLVRGPVRVGAGEGGVLYLLPPAIRQFRQRYPEADVIVRNQTTEETVRMLRAGDLDFGLRSRPPRAPGILYEEVGRADRVVIAPRRHSVLRRRRLTLADLAAHPFVMPWPHSTTRLLLETALAATGLPCRVVLEAGGWEVIKRYVALGLGIGIVPAFCVQPEDRAVLGARSVRHLVGQDAYGVLVRHGMPLSPSARELLRLIAPRLP
jgi:DNA-binding transcriptional LysR family regulator